MPILPSYENESAESYIDDPLPVYFDGSYSRPLIGAPSAACWNAREFKIDF
jgi:hypothetical protein